MLSGMKTGKRKRKGNKGGGKTVVDPPAGAASVGNSSGASLAESNQSAAEQLRQSLLSASSPTIMAPSAKKDPAAKEILPHEMLERSGRIQPATKANSTTSGGDNNDAVVVGMTSGSISRAEALLARRGDNNNDNQQKRAVSSFAEGDMSMDEMLSRNVMRMGKHKKQKMNSNIDSDEEEIRVLNMMMPEETTGKKKSVARQQKDDDKAKRREIARELHLNDKQDSAMARCWWWLESPKFAKHRLLSLGNHVSFVMTPLNLSLTPGLHFYLVPIKHAESLAGCEEEVWDEIHRFQASLRKLFDKEYSRGLLFSETVLPSKNFSQTKMEIIPVKKKYWLDAELYFKSTLAEQADDFGTHNKPLSTKGKGLRRTVPGKGFPYFFVEWDAPNQGVAQMIESSTFPQDFAADTIAGMIGADPIRFNRKKKFTSEEERSHILSFLDKWKKYDWTETLDA